MRSAQQNDAPARPKAEFVAYMIIKASTLGDLAQEVNAWVTSHAYDRWRYLGAPFKDDNIWVQVLYRPF